jgi:hypothetical protein
MRILLGSAALVLISVSMFAQDTWNGNGESLLRNCSVQVRVLDGEKVSSAEAVDGGICVGYLWGVHDIEFFVQMFEEHQKVAVMRHSCVPSNASTGQIVRVVVKYLRDNPKHLNMPASVLVTDAIRSAFPCK